MDRYNVDDIIDYACNPGVDISPADRQEWTFLCCALKVLGYDVNTFVSMSNCSKKECIKVWNKEKNPTKYVPNEDKAKAKIIALAKAAGVNISAFKIGEGKMRVMRVNEGSEGSEGKMRVNEGKMRVNEGSEGKVKKSPIFITSNEMIEMTKEVKQSALFNYLCSIFPQEKVLRVFISYCVGATNEFNTSAPHLASTFPYVNIDNYIVDIHLQPYESNGHRWKEDKHKYCQNWLLAKKKQSECRAAWCLFGEHLLKSKEDAPVAIVESEKTALIGSLCAPEFIWCATGGFSQFTSNRLSAVKKRLLFMFPDAEKIDQWEKKADDLKNEGYHIFSCSQFVKDYATPGSKEDIADILIKCINEKK